ncbi:hypothetical protein HOH51_03895 [bacterium]|jgi:hypothetical protein|nr:hypothetical protein [bacterium]
MIDHLVNQYAINPLAVTVLVVGIGFLIGRFLFNGLPSLIGWVMKSIKNVLSVVVGAAGTVALVIGVIWILAQFA